MKKFKRGKREHCRLCKSDPTRNIIITLYSCDKHFEILSKVMEVILRMKKGGK